MKKLLGLSIFCLALITGCESPTGGMANSASPLCEMRSSQKIAIQVLLAEMTFPQDASECESVMVMEKGDFGPFLQALEIAGRLKMQSQPRILTLAGQEAEIQVGHRVPYMTNSRKTDKGQAISTVQYEDVGTLLRITPYLEGEMICFKLEVKLSTLADSCVDISEGVKSPVINNYSVKTAAKARDGQTVVICCLPEARNSAGGEASESKEHTGILLVLKPQLLSDDGESAEQAPCPSKQ